MRVLQSGWLAGLALALAGCAGGPQSAGTTAVSVSSASSASCHRMSDLDQQVAEVYDVSRVRRVAPVYRTQFLARAIQPRYIAGAELYLDAERGVSQAYLQRVLACHAAVGSAAHPNDPLRAPDVRNVQVRTEGARFVVSVSGADRAAGRQIWQKAEALMQSQGRVGIQQLSAAEAARSEL